MGKAGSHDAALPLHEKRVNQHLHSGEVTVKRRESRVLAQFEHPGKSAGNSQTVSSSTQHLGSTRLQPAPVPTLYPKRDTAT